MGLQETPKGERFHIVLYGKRNVGKSSLLNALTGQPLAIVSDIAGTTTDPVSKAMEILPLGPCLLVDTPGLDDEGELGRKRVEKALQAMNTADAALLVLDAGSLWKEYVKNGKQTDGKILEKERTLAEKLQENKIPYVLVLNQADRLEEQEALELKEMFQGFPAAAVLTSAVENRGMEELKQALIRLVPEEKKERYIIRDLICPGEMVVLVVPVDSAAPKGRIILPQQQVLREILDHHAAAVVTQPEELPSVLERFKGQIRLVVTDSQAFKEVDAMVPGEIFLTSFSILFARYKGELDVLTDGVKALEHLKDGSRILISEGCTHHRQCEDIGTVKIPGLLKKYTGKELVLETSSGGDFPEKLDKYALVIHCGGCTLHEKEMKRRLACAKACQVPIVNYGIFLAYVNGILERSTEILSVDRDI